MSFKPFVHSFISVSLSLFSVFLGGRTMVSCSVALSAIHHQSAAIDSIIISLHSNGGFIDVVVVVVIVLVVVVDGWMQVEWKTSCEHCGWTWVIAVFYCSLSWNVSCSYPSFRKELESSSVCLLFITGCKWIQQVHEGGGVITIFVVYTGQQKLIIHRLHFNIK